MRDGDEWVINGAKMWTTMAHEAKWLILLTRTDPELPKHRGLTMFILPMDTPGITVDPVHTMATERTNATYYDDVRVGDEAVLGEVNGGLAHDDRRPRLRARRDGWHQRGGAAAAPLPRLGRHESGVIDVSRSPASAWPASPSTTRSPRLLTQRSAWIAASGGPARPRGLDDEGLRDRGLPEGGAAGARRWPAPRACSSSTSPAPPPTASSSTTPATRPVTTIYGGTTEINRNNIAERHLGLPKARR